MITINTINTQPIYKDETIKIKRYYISSVLWQFYNGNKQKLRINFFFFLLQLFDFIYLEAGFRLLCNLKCLLCACGGMFWLWEEIIWGEIIKSI